MARVEPEPVLEEFEELLEMIEQVLEDDPKDAAFFEDIQTKAKSMVVWIEENNVATDNHERAVRNWRDLLEERVEKMS